MEKTALAEMKDGRFARTDSIHRNSIGDPHFPPEHGRYLLVAAYACPWAHRCLIARALYGLEQAIPLAITRGYNQVNLSSYGHRILTEKAGIVALLD